MIGYLSMHGRTYEKTVAPARIKLASKHSYKIGTFLTILMKVLIHRIHRGNPSSRFWDVTLLRILQFDRLSEHAWARPQKILVSHCSKLWRLFACKESTSSHTLFKRYYTLKNPSTWLDKSTLANSLSWNINGNMVFSVHFGPFYPKLDR